MDMDSQGQLGAGSIRKGASQTFTGMHQAYLYLLMESLWKSIKAIMYAITSIPERAGDQKVADPISVKVGKIGLARWLVTEILEHGLGKRREVVLSRPCMYGVFSGPVGGFSPRPSTVWLSALHHRISRVCLCHP